MVVDIGYTKRYGDAISRAKPTEINDNLNKIESKARELERMDCLVYLRKALRVMEVGIPENATAKEVRKVDCMFLRMVIEMIEDREKGGC